MDRAVASKNAANAALAIANRDMAIVKAFDEELRPRIKRRRRRLRNLFGSTISTVDGNISMSTSSDVLDYDEKRKPELLAELERRHIKKAIRYKPEINFKALGQMSPSFIRTLAHLGVTRGQMSYVSIHSPGEKDATNLLKIRRDKK